MRKITVRKILCFLLMLAMLAGVFTSCDRGQDADNVTSNQDILEEEELDPLLKLWNDFINDKKLNAVCIRKTYNVFSSMAYPAMLEKDLIDGVIFYLKALDFNFIGTRTLTEEDLSDFMRRYPLLTISDSESITDNEIKIYCAVKDDGTFVIQDRVNGYEMYTESESITSNEFWNNIDPYFKQITSKASFG